MLILEHLKVTINSRVLLEDFNANWGKGSLVAVLGPNGSGKTTLLNHLAGVTRQNAGRVLLFGGEISQFSSIDRASRIASTAQYDSADLETIAFDRIAHGLYARRQQSNLTPSEEKALIDRIAVALDIKKLLPQPLFALSGGQRKKVHIARCLVDNDADMYVLDEPDASLDANSRENVLGQLRQLANSGKLVIASLHHRELAHAYADTLLDLGQSEDNNPIIDD